MTHFEAVVLGAGPGGLATVAGLLDGGLHSILWIDRTFEGGRLNQLYREISSCVLHIPPRHLQGLRRRNTKVGIYLDTMRSSSTCTRIMADAPKPNAITRLEEIDREETCQLSLAGDMIRLLMDGILGFDGVEKVVGEVEEAILQVRQDPRNRSRPMAENCLQDSNWTLRLPSRDSITTSRFFLCTGSYPTPAHFHETYNPKLSVLDLDRCMVRSTLPSMFPKDRPSIIAVIGNSHSGILVCRNLYEAAREGDRDLRIVNFRRRPIKYAEYRDDGIVFDNTGLKGATADWAKRVMEQDADSNVLQQIDLEMDQDSIYRKHLPRCTHIVYAIGYTPSALPRLFVEGQRVDQDLDFDMHTSGFRIPGQKEMVKGLFGCGIAFPEMVEDPDGHVEAAVGVGKFFKFAERVKGDWVAVR